MFKSDLKGAEEEGENKSLKVSVYSRWLWAIFPNI